MVLRSQKGQEGGADCRKVLFARYGFFSFRAFVNKERDSRI